MVKLAMQRWMAKAGWTLGAIAVFAVGWVGAGSSGAAQLAMRLQIPRLVVIEAGRFLQGTDAAGLSVAVRLCRRSVDIPEACRPEVFEDEIPQRRVHISRFAIDRWEVANGEYRRCVSAGACAPATVAPADGRLAHRDHPVVGITWIDAQRYCAFVGGRLPTEAEWERAARGVDGRQFPWGNLYNDRLANHGRRMGEADIIDGFRYAAPVQSFPQGRSPQGLRHMAGNVWELTADYYAEETYSDAQTVDPRGPTHGDMRVMRGGSWRSASYQLRAAHRSRLLETESRPDVGFRCAYEI